jgi:hypothetical protein
MSACFREGPFLIASSTNVHKDIVAHEGDATFAAWWSEVTSEDLPDWLTAAE